MPETLEMPHGRVRQAPVKVPASSPVAAPEAGDSAEYKQLVSDTAELVRAANKTSLEYYFTLGEKVNELLDSPPTKGMPKIQQFSKDLLAQTGVNLGTSSLYKASTFERSFTKTELNKMIKAGFAWRNVTHLLTSEINDATRKEFVGRVEAGELQQNKIKDAVAEKIGKVLKGRGGRNSQPQQVLGRVAHMSKTLMERVVGLDPLINKINNYKAPTRAGYKDVIEQAVEGLEQLQREVRTRLTALRAVEFDE